MSTNQPPLSISINAKLEIGCYTCSKRKDCTALRHIGLSREQLQQTRNGHRITVRREGRHPIGWMCIGYEPEPTFVENRRHVYNR